jgi:hypothetical protein
MSVVRPGMQSAPGLSAFTRVSVAGVAQHPAQVDHLLDADVFAVWTFEALGLASERHYESSVVLLLDGGDCLKKRERGSPLNVVTSGMLEDLFKGVTVMVAEMHGLGWQCHRDSSFDRIRAGWQ